MKRTIQKKTMPVVEDLPSAEAFAELILNEMGSLYRERLRAHYNGDLEALARIDRRIETLKEKL